MDFTSEDDTGDLYSRSLVGLRDQRRPGESTGCTSCHGTSPAAAACGTRARAAQRHARPEGR
ncbi:hypothetical protein HF668_13685, partial [Acidithiobacillus ferridurans]|uniref:hypothetical protein n=1 Tax=Acidithiobacillus ferridurans TaxID=1232575 RepID=UPI001C068923